MTKGLHKKRIIVILGIIAAIVLMFALSFAAEYSGLNKSEDLVIVTIPEGSGASRIAEILTNNRIINNKTLFKIAAIAKNKAGKFKHGSYNLSPSMGYAKIIGIISGEIKGGATVKITIPEGYELEMIADRLKPCGISAEDFIKAANEAEFDYDFLKDLPERENRLEGYLYPDTYFIDYGSEAKDIINIMLRQFDKEFNDEYRKRAAELNMTIDKVVTLASIIQREAQNEEEMPIVSAVFHNRLKNKDYPYLQSCATVQYILKERKPVLSVSDTKIDSPYNTYINKGLPIGPIASPGRAAIKAALYPADVGFLFFALNEDGKHVFSNTYEEHLKVANGRQ